MTTLSLVLYSGVHVVPAAPPAKPTYLSELEIRRSPLVLYNGVHDVPAAPETNLHETIERWIPHLLLVLYNVLHWSPRRPGILRTIATTHRS